MLDERVLAKEAYEDFQIILWHDRLPRHSNLLLILMRTPSNADMFSKPPKVAPTIHISWLTFPMAKIFLECVAKAHCSIESEFDNLKGNPQGSYSCFLKGWDDTSKLLEKINAHGLQ
ncbi:hypothetical protein Gotri_002098 [Gossypium trilobum]|uniref:Uncharacterized protein n=1 Tax=Gossypium trilobum TaxID=34281 RepID=A0A7J9F768_9ROSI|nr:hypothetical protein [Gossypium trilobum]